MRRCLGLALLATVDAFVLRAPKALLHKARMVPLSASGKNEPPMVTQFASPYKEADAVEGLPWWWEYFWKLPFTKRGEPGTPLTLGDTMHVFRTNIEQIYGGFPSVDGTPLAKGDLSGYQFP